MSTFPYCVRPAKSMRSCCDCVGWIMSFIFLISATIYRFRWSGKVCSGNFVTPDEEEERRTVMFASGEFMFGWVITWWCLFPIIAIFKCIEHKKTI